MYNLNPRDMEKVMKRMGIKQSEIDAEEIIIKCKDKNLVIRDPSVIKVNMMGQDMLQVSGHIEEVSRNLEIEINEEDIQAVIGNSNCTKEQAIEALKKTNGNIAEAIMNLNK